MKVDKIYLDAPPKITITDHEKKRTYVWGWERERGKKEEADKWGPLRVVGIEDDI